MTVEADGHSVTAKRAIVAIAPTLAGRIAYDPPLPGFRDQLTQRMPLGTVAKCMAIYDEPFWRVEGLSGQGTSDTGPVKLTFDNSPPGRLARRAARASSRAATRASSAACPPSSAAPRWSTASPACSARARPGRTRYVERLWAEEEWSRGCYGCHMPTGAWTDYGPALREPIGPIALGRRRVRHGLERLHGRRRALRRAGRGAGAGTALGRRLVARAHARVAVAVDRVDHQAERQPGAEAPARWWRAAWSSGRRTARRRSAGPPARAARGSRAPSRAWCAAARSPRCSR